MFVKSSDMGTYRVQLDDGREYEIETDDAGASTSSSASETFDQTRDRRLTQPFLQNVKESGKDVGSSLVQSVLHPVQTAQGVVDLSRGLFEKSPAGDINVPVPSSKKMPVNLQEREKRSVVADSFMNLVKQRYGSPTSIMETAKTDPVGFALDASTVFSLSGGGLRAAGVKSGGQTVSRVGTELNPVRQVSRAGNAVSGPLKDQLGSLAERFYQSALKPGVKFQKGGKTVRTGIEEGIQVSEQGLQNVHQRIDMLNNDIKKLIDSSASKSQSIPIQDVVTRLDELKEFYRSAIGGDTSIKNIDAIAKQFEKMNQSGFVTVKNAQKIKQNTYRLLRKSYGEFKSAEVESTKGLVRGLKEEIAKRVPGIDALNARESNLIPLQNALERATGRIKNTNVVPLTPSILLGAGAAITGNRPLNALLAGLIGKIIDTPSVKSEIGILLNKVSKVHGLPKKTTSFENIVRSLIESRMYLDNANNATSVDSDSTPLPRQ